MSDKDICATCLVIDVKMIQVTMQIRKMYLEITGFQATECVSIPCYVCYLCHALIQKFHKFKKKCLASQNILDSMQSSKGKITKTAIKTLDRKAHGLESHLSYIEVLKSSVTSVPSSIYSFEDDSLNDNPYPLKTVKNEFDQECLFEPILSGEVVKIENEVIDIEPPKPSYQIFVDNVVDMSFEINEEDKKVTVEIEKQVANTGCVSDESYNENVDGSYSDIEIKSIKCNRNLKSKKAKKCSKKSRARKKPYEDSTVAKLFHIQIMNPEDQKLQLLSRQMSSAYTSRKYKCELCYTGFNAEAAYNHHKNKHEYGVFGKLLCDLCKKYSCTKKAMSDHIHHDHFNKYTCKTCGHISYSMGSALLHHRKKHETISYKCPFCAKEFGNIHALSAHKMRLHATVPCGRCGHCFVNKQGLIYHQKYKHGIKDPPTLEVDKEDQLYCKDCQTLFANHDAYCLHMVKSSKHSKDEAIQCSNERESQRTIKVSRMLATRTVKAVHCRECEAVLPGFKQAVSHYKSHHPESKLPRDYVCDVCGKAFTYPKLLETHVNTHTKAVNFACPECPKTFSCNANRSRHVKQVHREKNLLCNQCDFKTSTKFDLKIHIQVVHMKMPYLPRIRAERKRVEKRRRMDLT